LNNYRYGYKKHGYIFVVLFSKNSKCKLKELVNPNKIEEVGECLPLNKPDIRGFYFRKRYVEDILSKGFSVVSYYYKIPGTNMVGKKVSYIALYKPWNWLIGTGYYLKDIGAQFYKEKMSKIWKTGEKVLIAVFLILMSSAGIFLFFFKRINTEFEKIIEFLEGFPNTKYIDTDNFRFSESTFIARKINNLALNVEELSKKQQDMIARYTSVTNYMRSCIIIAEKVEDRIIIKDINRCVQKCMGIEDKDKVIGLDVKEIFGKIPFIVKKFEDVFAHHIVIESIDISKNLKNCGYQRYFQTELFKISEKEAVYIADDITDSVLLYYRSRIEKERLSSLIEDIDVGVVVVNYDMKIMFYNSKVKDIFGLKSENVNYLADLFLDKDTKAEIKSYFDGVVSKEIKCDGCVVEIETFNNNKKWIEITATVDNVNNEPVVVISIKDITYKYLKEKEIEYISLHDELTGLHNRRFFKEELNRLFDPRSYPLAIIIFDINGLKVVNDTLGHTWGDWLIKKVASILKASVRSIDILARIGGDEFVLLMPNTDEDGVKMCIERIRSNLERENQKPDQPYLSVSIGYAIQKGQFSNPDKFFAEADKAMYEEKFSNTRNSELMRIWESVKHLVPDTEKLHTFENFFKR